MVSSDMTSVLRMMSQKIEIVAGNFFRYDRTISGKQYFLKTLRKSSINSKNPFYRDIAREHLDKYEESRILTRSADVGFCLIFDF
jgi:hypothetical protein